MLRHYLRVLRDLTQVREILSEVAQESTCCTP